MNIQAKDDIAVELSSNSKLMPNYLISAIVFYLQQRGWPGNSVTEDVVTLRPLIAQLEEQKSK